jgi:hypothetical protein
MASKGRKEEYKSKLIETRDDNKLMKKPKVNQMEEHNVEVKEEVCK